MARHSLKIILLSVLILPFSLGAQNVLISSDNASAEPSIMFDPYHPDRVVAGTNLSQQYYSRDGGKTWVTQNLESTYGVWGDPVIDVDSKGHFYYFHLSNPANGQGSWIDRIVCQKSIDAGKTWNNGSHVGKNGIKAQDKHWSCIDNVNNIIYLTWTQFDTYGTNLKSEKSNILFSKSEDFGETWSDPMQINSVSGNCVDGDSTTEGAVPAVGPNGEVYVCWAGPLGLTFNKSVDQGKTWLKNEILVDPMPGGWKFIIPGIWRCNGLPITKCDISKSEYNGTIYVNWTDQRNGTLDTDVWLAKSEDKGETWSDPIRVNDDLPGKQQFFTWMDIDQTTGFLYFVFYDRRNYTDNMTDVFMAISKDGGETFENIKISEEPFLPNSGVFFGDYTNIVAHAGRVRPIWTRADTTSLSLYTDISYPKRTTEVGEEIINLQATQYPNPSSDITYVSYKFRKSSSVSLKIYDYQGRLVNTVIDFENIAAGRYTETIRKSELGLADGIYHAILTVNETQKVFKMIFTD